MDTPIKTTWLPALLQVSDPLFPTGAYAHSAGLEEMVRMGFVSNQATLLTFLESQIIPQLQHLEMPYARFSYSCALHQDLDGLSDLAQEVSAWKLPQEARDASLQMGSRRLETLRKTFPSALLDEFAKDVKEPHHIVVYGLQMALLQVPIEAALMGYFYQTISGNTGASLKLIRIGQESIQRVMRRCLERCGEGVAKSLLIERDEACWFNPLLEIAAMRHERATERLFIS